MMIESDKSMTSTIGNELACLDVMLKISSKLKLYSKELAETYFGVQFDCGTLYRVSI